MKIKLCLALVLVPCLAQAAGPSSSACAQAFGTVKQRLAQAYSDQDETAVATAKRQLAAIDSQCEAAQRQRQQTQDNQLDQRNLQLQRLQQQRYQQQRRTQQLNQQRVEEQRLRQRMYQQHLDNQRKMPDIRY